MKITRDVITDLLPVYLANEASNDTRALVEEFLKQDPDFAKLITEQGTPPAPSSTHIPKEIEMQTLQRTRVLLRKRSLFMAFAVLFTGLAFAFTFDRNGLHWLWTESPISALINLILGSWTDASITGVVNLVIGAYFWIRFFQTNQNLKESGL